MDRAEKALVEEVARDARGDADVARSKRGGEGVGRDVLAPALEVVAELGDQVQREPELCGWVKAAVEDAVVDRIRIARDVCDERKDRPLGLGETRLERLVVRAGVI